MTILSETQCRTARALLNWSQTDLAKKANLSESTIRDFEKGRRVPSTNNLAAITAAFRQAGVQLLYDGHSGSIGGEGVRFSEDSSGKKLEAERDHLEKELKSTKQLVDYIRQQLGLSDEMQDNTAYQRMIMQAQRDAEFIEMQLEHVKARLRSQFDIANQLAEKMGRMMNSPLDPYDGTF